MLLVLHGVAFTFFNLAFAVNVDRLELDSDFFCCFVNQCAVMHIFWGKKGVNNSDGFTYGLLIIGFTSM